MAHTSYHDLAEKLQQAHKLVEVGAFYRHYKDATKHYTVLALALQEESEAVCVVYQTSHPSGLIWVRDLDDWLASVKNAAGETVPRFEKVSN